MIHIRTRDKMRYTTCGDYYEENGDTFIDVFDQDNSDLNFLIALHKLIECHLITKRGISEKEITEYDKKYVKKYGSDVEPGADIGAPYHKEHIFAENIERIIAQELGINWKIYEENLKVYKPKKDHRKRMAENVVKGLKRFLTNIKK